MKRCNNCKKDLDLSKYYTQTSRFNNKVYKYKDSFCKICRNEYSLARRVQLKIQCVQYKGGKCIDCGLVDDPVVYDFHHLDPTEKEFSIGKRKNRCFEKLKDELDKCEMLCANCHRKKTWKKALTFNISK